MSAGPNPGVHTEFRSPRVTPTERGGRSGNGRPEPGVRGRRQGRLYQVPHYTSGKLTSRPAPLRVAPEHHVLDRDRVLFGRGEGAEVDRGVKVVHRAEEVTEDSPPSHIYFFPL